MKTINLELSKRLTPYLEYIDTEYAIYNIYMNDLSKGTVVLNEIEKKYFIKERGDIIQKICKTLTLEEAIDFLQSNEIKFTIEYGKEGYFFY